MASVKMCYDVTGKVVESTLIATSGNKRQDDAAVKMSKEIRYKPAMVDGKPVAGCTVQRIKFSPAQEQ